MAAPKRPTHIVVHKRLYMAVQGKMEHIPEGRQLTLTEKQAKGLGRRVKAFGGDTTDLTDTNADDKAGAKAEK